VGPDHLSPAGPDRGGGDVRGDQGRLWRDRSGRRVSETRADRPPGCEASMKLHRIAALLSRHLYLYKRSLPRVLEIIYWPFAGLLIWAFTTLSLAPSNAALPGLVLCFLRLLLLCG